MEAPLSSFFGRSLSVVVPGSLSPSSSQRGQPGCSSITHQSSLIRAACSSLSDLRPMHRLWELWETLERSGRIEGVLGSTQFPNSAWIQLHGLALCSEVVR